MPSLKSLTLALLFAVATALALPTNLNANTIASRADPSATCGSNSYSSSAVQAAQNAGCKYLQQGSTVGNDDYPHQYKDYEGFDFSTSSPWYEFPVLASGKVFDGSSGPGPDRVIFNGDCAFTAVITHTGASGDDFVECQF